MALGPRVPLTPIAKPCKAADGAEGLRAWALEPAFPGLKSRLNHFVA